MGVVQGRPGTFQVGGEVGHGRPEVVHGLAQNGQGYDLGRVPGLSLVDQGHGIRRWDVGQIGGSNNDLAIRVAALGGQASPPDPLPQSIAAVTAPDGSLGQGQPFRPG